MTDSNQRIDNTLNFILHAAGTSLDHCPSTKMHESMRKAVREVLADAYIDGSNDCYEAMKFVYDKVSRIKYSTDKGELK